MCPGLFSSTKAKCHRMTCICPIKWSYGSCTLIFGRVLFSWFSFLTIDWTVLWFTVWHGLSANELDSFHMRLTQKMNSRGSFNQLVTNAVACTVPNWSGSGLRLCERCMHFTDAYMPMSGVQHQQFHSTNSILLHNALL